jgi:hypothetical protein
MQDVPTSFKWNMPVWIDTAQVDIEINYSSVEIEVTDFEADTCVIFNRDLLTECLDMDDLMTLRRLCDAIIEERKQAERTD